MSNLTIAQLADWLIIYIYFCGFMGVFIHIIFIDKCAKDFYMPLRILIGLSVGLIWPAYNNIFRYYK